jgi:hypothetical protein
LDGFVAIVDRDPYQVTIVSPTGDRVAGPRLPFVRAPVTDSIKNAYIADLSGPSTGIAVGTGGRVNVLRSRPRALRVPASWVDYLPPFSGRDFVGFDSRGVLWIQRITFGREGAKYDLVDRKGAFMESVQLPPAHRLVGFGRGAMFIVARDDDDVERVERWPQSTR